MLGRTKEGRRSSASAPSRLTGRRASLAWRCAPRFGPSEGRRGGRSLSGRACPKAIRTPRIVWPASSGGTAHSRSSSGRTSCLRRDGRAPWQPRASCLVRRRCRRGRRHLPRPGGQRCGTVHLFRQEGFESVSVARKQRTDVHADRHLPVVVMRKIFRPCEVIERLGSGRNDHLFAARR